MTKPYIIVIHTLTKRAFTLSRNYNLVESFIENAFPAMFGPVERDSEWKGWYPTFESQRPEWANEIIRDNRDTEFVSWWLKD